MDKTYYPRVAPACKDTLAFVRTSCMFKRIDIIADIAIIITGIRKLAVSFCMQIKISPQPRCAELKQNVFSRCHFRWMQKENPLTVAGGGLKILGGGAGS